jgi:hypothetical protein
MKIHPAIKYCIVSISILSFYSVFLFCPEEVIYNLTKEDHFFEWLGTIFLLATSIICFIAFLKDKTGNDLFLFKTQKNYFLFVFTLMFFFAFGEELSWGQRLFHVQSPELLKEINYQQEINIHNLNFFSGLADEGHLFNYFWITFCLIMPFFYKVSVAGRKLLNKINLPIVPFWLAVFFLISFAFNLLIKVYFSGDLMHHAVSEIKETSFSFLFVVFSILCLTDNYR